MIDSPEQALALPRSHRDIINLWPSLKDYAADIGADYGTAKKHRQRNSIPDGYRVAAVLGAQRRGLPVSHDIIAATAVNREAL